MNFGDFYVHCTARLASGMRTLPDKPEETPAATLHALWHLAAGRRVSAASAAALPLPRLDRNARERLAALLEQRLNGVPLAYLTGMQRFMGLDLLSEKDAMIPRQETELLGAAALEFLRERAREQASVTVLDVCTGSGNLALAMARHEPKARVFGADLSAHAVALARRNAALLRLEARTEFRVGDLLAPFDAPPFHRAVDLLLCNPPYIPHAKVRELPEEIAAHEPRLAFDGGPLGFNLLVRLIAEAPRYLRPGAMLAMEVGLGQGPALLRWLQSRGLRDPRSVLDAAGQIRALLALA